MLVLQRATAYTYYETSPPGCTAMVSHGVNQNTKYGVCMGALTMVMQTDCRVCGGPRLNV